MLIVINDSENGQNIIGRCRRVEWGIIEKGRGSRKDGRGEMRIDDKRRGMIDDKEKKMNERR